MSRGREEGCVCVYVCKCVYLMAGVWPSWKVYHGGSGIGEMTSEVVRARSGRVSKSSWRNRRFSEAIRAVEGHSQILGADLGSQVGGACRKPRRRNRNHQRGSQVRLSTLGAPKSPASVAPKTA